MLVLLFFSVKYKIFFYIAGQTQYMYIVGHIFCKTGHKSLPKVPYLPVSKAHTNKLQYNLL